jgi:hypothetical protein
MQGKELQGSHHRCTSTDGYERTVQRMHKHYLRCAAHTAAVTHAQALLTLRCPSSCGNSLVL